MDKVKKAVMCCNAGMLQKLPVVKGTKELRHITLEQDVDPEQIHFLNRKLVDAKEDIDYDGYTIGKLFPQILPYVVIRHEGEYLTYDRKGAEERLHGKSSIGIGGHIDIEDIYIMPDAEGVDEADMVITILHSCARELAEEAGLTEVVPKFKFVLLSNKDEVGLVHAGFIAIIDLEDEGKSKSDITPKEELINPKWKKIDELVNDLDFYEDWSAKLIGWIDNGIIL